MNEPKGRVQRAERDDPMQVGHLGEAQRQGGSVIEVGARAECQSNARDGSRRRSQGGMRATCSRLATDSRTISSVEEQIASRGYTWVGGGDAQGWARTWCEPISAKDVLITGAT